MIKKKNKYILLIVIFISWLVFDRLTKFYFNQFMLGERISDSFLGIFHFTLVHNTGGAFGLLGDATYFLAAFSVLISVVLIIMFIKHIDKIKILHIISVAIICAGGIGNSIDRILNGYVIDFICFDFISFPVFNIADIGVTCGIVLLIIAMIKGAKNEC